MIYDFSFLSIWLTLAFLVGVCVGWWTEVSGAQAPWLFGWFRRAVVAWVIGLVIAWLHWLPGRLGFWLESALLFFAFYVLGCLLGGLLRSVFVTSEAAVAGTMPAKSWPFRIGEGSTSFATAARPLSSATAFAPPRAAAVISDVVVPPRAAAVVPDVVVPPRAAAVVARESPGRQASAVVSNVVVPPPAATVIAGVADRKTQQREETGATAPEPAAMGPVEGEGAHEGQRPLGLVAPRGGVADDLKHIRGIGQQNEGRLHGLGVWHFQQIADWTPDNVRWVGSYLAFPGRIDREQWIAQAKVLAQGLETEFSTRVEREELAGKRDDGTEGQQNIADVSKIKPRH